MAAVLAIDLGGTRLRAGRLADGAAPEAVAPLADEKAPASLEALVDRLRRLLDEAEADRLGIGVPGLTQGTLCRWVPNLGYLDGQDFAALLPGCNVALGNDAQIALLAEARAGAARGMEDAILLAIGTGIGSAVLSDGRIVSGHRGAACSFGWAVADRADPGDDKLGWLERHASGTALDAAARAAGLADGRALIEKARAGEARARAALAEPTSALGTALAGAVALLDPEAVILAGGVAGAADVLAPLIEARLRAHLPPHMRAVSIRAGRFGPRAGLVGAAIAGRLGPGWREAP